jgi:hypothetical protein
MAGDTESTERDEPRERRGNEGFWIGTILIGLGAVLLAGQLIPETGRYGVLVIGLALLAGFAMTRQYGFLVPGGIVTGVGVGVLLTQAYPSAGGLFLLSLAAGFASIWVIGVIFRLREHHWWPLIPAGILGTIGVISLADQSGQFGDLLRLAWPIALVILGAFIVLRAARSGGRRARD